MIDIKVWIENFTASVEQIFGNRVWFIGLQGSYGRDEATNTSDIDVVVILDEVGIDDLKSYRNMLDTLPYRDLICGFISGKNELLNWDISDLFQFFYDTTSVKGSLDILLEKINRQAVKRAILTGACNIYHACVHNYVHEKSIDILKSLYKSAIFVIQALHFYETGKYIKSHTELQNASSEYFAVIDAARCVKDSKNIEFESMSEILFYWAKNIILSYGE